MNKTKIIGLSNKLNSIVDEANRHPNGIPGLITWNKAVYAIEALSKEVNSKPVMPKIFDEWHEEELELCSCCEDEIDDLIDLSTESYMPHDSNSAYRLFEWINQNGQDDIKVKFGRFLKCIDAIRYGYEVEK